MIQVSQKNETLIKVDPLFMARFREMVVAIISLDARKLRCIFSAFRMDK